MPFVAVNEPVPESDDTIAAKLRPRPSSSTPADTSPLATARP